MSRYNKVSFVYDNQEFLVDPSKVSHFGIIKELEQTQQINYQTLVVQMPKWVTRETFFLFKEILNSKINSQPTDQTIQRMLWLGDHLQSDDFQEKIINELVLPDINLKNCTLFLNEAFKKLKACEESGDLWYLLLNTCMNYTAKNLIIISQQQPQDIHKINQKIVKMTIIDFQKIEEIIDRALKYHRRKNTTTDAELIKILYQMRQCQSPMELIQNQKKLILNRKINFSSHPSINWKLSNLSSIVNKETQSFKFSEFNWKLVAKMEQQQVLRIYLKLESVYQDDIQDTPRSKQLIENENREIPRITCLYFMLSLNNSYEKLDKYELKTAYILTEKNSSILLCEFKGEQELHAYDQQKLEFTVFLNTDQLLTLAINYIFQNLESIMLSKPDISQFDLEDVQILLQATPNLQKTQEQALSYVIHFISKIKIPITLQIQLLNTLKWESISIQFMSNAVKNPEIQHLYDFIRFIESKLHMQQNSTSRVIEQKDRSFFLNEESQSNQSFQKIQSQSQERQVSSQNMPTNKLEKLKKNASQTRIGAGNKIFEDYNIRRESAYSQQSSSSQNEKSFSTNINNNNSKNFIGQNININNNVTNTNNNFTNTNNNMTNVNNKVINTNSNVNNTKQNTIHSNSNNNHNNVFQTVQFSEKDMRRKTILEEINIVQFLKTNDPHLIKELDDVMKQFF